jgi:short-subunit dehydrogenase
MAYKVIIIGATSGIGEELAKIYAQQDCIVGISGRRQELLDSLQQKFPDKIVTECFDVTGNENKKHIENLIQKLGGLDLLIYNSGYAQLFSSLRWEIEKQTTLVNVNGFVEIINIALNYFLKQKKGQIAVTSSIASIRGNSLTPAYNASKAYVSSYMEGLSIKMYKQKLPIYLTDIQPGFVDTEMAQGNGTFWVAPVEKAAKQIYRAIKNKKRRVYVTKRWWIIAQILKVVPYSIYKHIG